MCGPRGGRSENRVRLAPRFRHPLRTFSHPWWLHERALACKRLYRSTLPRSARSRRRSVPPSLSVPVSQSVNQRWRERPRCPAPPSDPRPSRRGRSRHRWSCRMSLSARTGRAGRTRRPRARLRVRDSPEQCGRQIDTEIGSCASHCVPGRNVAFCGSRSRRRTIALSCWRRARRRQCSSLRFDPAGGRAFGH